MTRKYSILTIPKFEVAVGHIGELAHVELLKGAKYGLFSMMKLGQMSPCLMS